MTKTISVGRTRELGSVAVGGGGSGIVGGKVKLVGVRSELAETAKSTGTRVRVVGVGEVGGSGGGGGSRHRYSTP